MKTRNNRGLSWLALATISGALWAGGPLRTLAKEELVGLKAAEDSRVARISDHMGSLKASYGLTGADELRATRQSTDEFGKTHVHYTQLYEGAPVWGSGLIGHMDAGGNVEEAQAKVFSGIQLESTSLMGTDDLRRRALQHLQVADADASVKLEKVVFPTQLQGGLKLKRNEKKELVLDEAFSVTTPRKAVPYVWAYHVTVRQGKYGLQGFTEMILDAITGEVLQKWDGRNYGTPGTATGHSLYNGTVTLNTTTYDWVNTLTYGNNWLPPTGTYNTLCDTTRATRLFPLWEGAMEEMTDPGIKTFWCDNFVASNRLSTAGPYLSTGTEWGDGLPWMGWETGNVRDVVSKAALSINGQTEAVDATYGVMATWDFYKNVFGRNGIDGEGSAPTIWVHKNDGIFFNVSPMCNAYWDGYMHSMYFGDGDASLGYGPFTSMDITAHELAHGVTGCSGSGLYNGFESGGINEATSDVFSAMTRFYMWGPAKGTGTTIPDTAPNAPLDDALWTIGRQLTTDHSALRNMVKPSLDGYSYDQWFDGLYLDDVHFTMGPGNRLFYFLSQGASATQGNVAYSPCLPKGMTGLGNDKAARIWYRAITTKLADRFMDYHGFRTIMVESAGELFGSNSTEVAAVQNAFAAINVGAPAGGTDPILVTMPQQMTTVADDTNGYAWASIINGFVVVPQSSSLFLLPAPSIKNTTNTAYTWSLGGLSAAAKQGGKVVDGKYFYAPNQNQQFWALQVSSDADPARYAATAAYVTNMDSDVDTEFDALDLAAYALNWGRHTGTNPSSLVPLADASANYVVDDVDLALVRQGFNNVFAH